MRNRLAKRRIWRRILLERLSEPLHLNIASLAVAAFGTTRAKIDWDLVLRQPYAWGVLAAADLAHAAGAEQVHVVEFGVASGTGLMNLSAHARRVRKATGVNVQVHGFDTGRGMPPAVDYRDHPELYQEGDFPMQEEALRAALPEGTFLHIGPLGDTVPAFLEGLNASAPLGFVSIDVDYYSSTVEALEALAGPADKYLPWLPVYLDDVALPSHNSRAGELLAVAEFNDSHANRVIERHAFFETGRIFRRAPWLRNMFFAHILDHEARTNTAPVAMKRYIENPYLGAVEQPKERFRID
jgi:hypothetical protein